MTSPKSDRVNRRSLHFIGITWMLGMALATLILAAAVALECITSGSEKWVTLGFKILELSVQMVLVTVLGGVLVQAYIKWHSRASSINEFRKTTAEAVIREYSVAKKVRRLIRASCVQGPAGNEIDPWTDIPTGAYDGHMSSISDAQLALELVKRRLGLLGAANGLIQKAKSMEEYLGEIIGEYERHRNPELKRNSIPLSELPRLRAFIASKPDTNKASDFNQFRKPFDELLELLETEGIWVAI